ncbi:MAG TPA: RagB/SusD family nutrient uptake outer membrane protein [Cyclobacteriaceae bacterium]|nr:RagB/SusD family nutrient uptake outer membrane protein [Cyclobacteriaceae bacterium]
MIRRFLIVVLVMITSSCGDFLNLKPTDLLTDDNALQTLGDFEQALIGCYSGLTSGNYYGGNYIVAADRMSDDLRRSRENLGEGVQLHSYLINAGTSEPAAIWSQIYSVINRANIVITKIDAVEGSQGEKNSIKGQALFIRALGHFDLVRYFSQRYNATPDASHLGVPVMLESVIGQPSRNTVAEVYSQVVSDLQQSVELMTQNLRPYKAYDLAALALLARVSLYMQDWEAARDYATEVINVPGLSLSTGDSYRNIWTTAELNDEVIFKLVMLQNNAFIGQDYWSQSNDIVSFNPTEDLINLYDQDRDVRFSAFIGLRQPDDPDNVVAKYRGAPIDYPLDQIPPNDGLADIKILRLSEMYLIRAEANYELQDPTAARNDLNAIRVARIGGFNPATEGNESGNALFDAIITERRKELAFEGQRWQDLKRLGLPIVRGSDCSATQCELEADDYRFTMPIPQVELAGNVNMEQNPGYEGN